MSGNNLLFCGGNGAIILFIPIVKQHTCLTGIKNCQALWEKFMIAVIQYAVNAVMPILLLILLGVLAKKKGFLEPAMLRKINKFNFRFNFSAMMFVNLYGVKNIRHISYDLGVFMLASLTVLLLLGFWLSGFLTKERFRRGVLVQAMFRSNYAIIGIPVAAALVGDEGAQLASFLQLPTVLFYNFMSVLALSFFSDYEAQYRLYGEGPLADPARSGAMKALDGGNTQNVGIDIGKILKGIATNPLIQGLLAGFAALLIREVIPLRADGELVFCLERDIPWLYSSLQSLSRMATPLALIVLGGQLEMKEIGEYKKELAAGITMRLVGAPLVGFGLLFAAVKLGLLIAGPVEIAVCVAVFGSPMAVASIVMSSEMGGDGHLCGQIVVWSSILGMFSLFFIILFLRMYGLL